MAVGNILDAQLSKLGYGNGAGASKAAQKEAKLKGRSEEKSDKLGGFKYRLGEGRNRLKDADTQAVGSNLPGAPKEETFRQSGNIDTPETGHGRTFEEISTSNAPFDIAQTKRIKEQALKLDDLRGLAQGSTTGDEVLAQGDEVQNQLMDFYQRGNKFYPPNQVGMNPEDILSGPPQAPLVEVVPTGKIGAKGRIIADTFNSQGESSRDFLDTSQRNMDFLSPYNQVQNVSPKKAEEVLALQARAYKANNRTGTEAASDTAGSAINSIVFGNAEAAMSILDAGTSNMNINPAMLPTALAYKALTGKEMPSFSSTKVLKEAGINIDFDRARAGVDSIFQSDMLRASKKKVAKIQADYAEKGVERIAELKKNGEYTKFVSEFADQAKQAGVAIESLWDNPAAGVDSIVASVGSILTSGIAGGAAKKAGVKKAAKLLNNESKRVARKTLWTKAGKGKMGAKEAAKSKAAGETFKRRATAGGHLQKKGVAAATTAGVASNVAMEASPVYSQTKERLISQDFQTLEKNSASYRKYREQDLSEEKSRELAANDDALFATAMTAVATAALSKFSGTGKFEGNIGDLAFGARSKLIKDMSKLEIFKAGLNLLGRPSVAGAREFVEEGGQGTTGKLIENYIAQRNIDPNQDILEGVGSEAGSNAFAGLGMGTVTSGLREIPQAMLAVGKDGVKLTKGAAKAAKVDKAASALATAAKKRINKFKDNRKSAATQIKENPDDYVGNIDRLIRDFTASTDPDERNAIVSGDDNAPGMSQVLGSMTDRIDEMKADPNYSPAQIQAAEDKQAEYVRKVMKLVESSNKGEDVSISDVDENSSEEDTEKAAQSTVNKSFGSEDIEGSEKELKAVVANKKVSRKTKRLAEQALDIVEQKKSLNASINRTGKDAGKVQQEILGSGHNDRNKLGLQEHIGNVQIALNAGQPELARAAMRGLETFVAKQQKRLANIKQAIANAENKDHPDYGKYSTKDSKLIVPDTNNFRLVKGSTGLVDRFIEPEMKILTDSLQLMKDSVEGTTTAPAQATAQQTASATTSSIDTTASPAPQENNSTLNIPIPPVEEETITGEEANGPKKDPSRKRIKRSATEKIKLATLAKSIRASVDKLGSKNITEEDKFLIKQDLATYSNADLEKTANRLKRKEKAYEGLGKLVPVADRASTIRKKKKAASRAAVKNVEQKAKDEVELKRREALGILPKYVIDNKHTSDSFIKATDEATKEQLIKKNNYFHRKIVDTTNTPEETASYQSRYQHIENRIAELESGATPTAKAAKVTTSTTPAKSSKRAKKEEGVKLGSTRKGAKSSTTLTPEEKAAKKATRATEQRKIREERGTSNYRIIKKNLPAGFEASVAELPLDELISFNNSQHKKIADPKSTKKQVSEAKAKAAVTEKLIKSLEEDAVPPPAAQNESPPVGAAQASSGKLTLVGKGNNRFLSKDQQKADLANSFIGHGAEGTSTAAYHNDAKSQGIPSNGEIVADKDTVAFVSVNGGPSTTKANLLKTYEDAVRVLKAGGRIVMDNDANANRDYNKNGEGELQTQLKGIAVIDEKLTTPEYNVYMIDPGETAGQPSVTETPVSNATMDDAAKEIADIANSDRETNLKRREALLKEIADQREAINKALGGINDITSVVPIMAMNVKLGALNIMLYGGDFVQFAKRMGRHLKNLGFTAVAINKGMPELFTTVKAMLVGGTRANRNTTDRLLDYATNLGYELEHVETEDMDRLVVGLANKVLKINTKDPLIVASSVALLMAKTMANTKAFEKFQRDIEASKYFKQAYNALNYKPLDSETNENKIKNKKREVAIQMLEQAILKKFNKEIAEDYKISDSVWSTMRNTVRDTSSFLTDHKENDLMENWVNYIVQNTFAGRDIVDTTPKEGHERLIFQKAFNNNPLAKQILTEFANWGNFMLTGSIAYAPQGPVYRDANNPIHDLDFISMNITNESSTADMEEEINRIRRYVAKKYPNSYAVYDFSSGITKKQLSVIFIPDGYTVRDVKRVILVDSKGVETETNKIESYRIVDSEGFLAGTFDLDYKTDPETGDIIEGSEKEYKNRDRADLTVEGIFTDFMMGNTDPITEAVVETFVDSNGKKQDVLLSPFGRGFQHKLKYSRYKDFYDWIRFKPYPKSFYKTTSITPKKVTVKNKEDLYKQDELNKMEKKLKEAKAEAAALREAAAPAIKERAPLTKKEKIQLERKQLFRSLREFNKTISEKMFTAGLETEQLILLAKIGATYVKEGLNDFASFAKAILKDMKAMGFSTKAVSPFVEEIYMATQGSKDLTSTEKRSMDPVGTVLDTDINAIAKEVDAETTVVDAATDPVKTDAALEPELEEQIRTETKDSTTTPEAEKVDEASEYGDTLDGDPVESPDYTEVAIEKAKSRPTIEDEMRGLADEAYEVYEQEPASGLKEALDDLFEDANKILTQPSADMDTNEYQQAIGQLRKLKADINQLLSPYRTEGMERVDAVLQDTPKNKGAHESLRLLANLALNNPDARDARDKLLSDLAERSNTENISDTVLETVYAFYEAYGFPSSKDALTANSARITVKKGGVTEVVDPRTDARVLMVTKGDPTTIFSQIPGVLSMINVPSIAAKIAKKFELTDEMLAAFQDLAADIKMFSGFHDDIYENKRYDNKILNNNSMVDIFKDEQGRLPENMLTTMVLGTMIWLAQNGKGSFYRMEGEINSFLGYQKGTALPPAAYGILTDIGEYRATVEDAVAATINTQLNVAMNSNEGGDSQRKLNTSMGIVALTLVEHFNSDKKDNLLQLTYTTNKTINDEIRDEDEVNDKPLLESGLGAVDAVELEGPVNFVRMAFQIDRDTYGRVPTNNAAILLEEFNGTETTDSRYKGLFEKIMGTTLEAQDPPLEKPESPPKHHQRTKGAEISDVISEGIDNYNSQEMGIQERMAHILDVVADPILYAMDGYKSIEEVHAAQADSQDSKNQGIVDGIGASKSFINKLQGFKNWFRDQVSWRNLRAGDGRFSISPQRNKQQRQTFGLDYWEETVDISGKNDNQVNLMKVAIGEALGKGADKNTHTSILEFVRENIMADDGTMHEDYAPVVAALLRAKKIKGRTQLFKEARDSGTELDLEDINIKQLDPADQTIIADMVKKGGEKFHSLNGLMALADLSEALQDPEVTSVDLTLTREVDGTTNGVIFAVLQLGGGLDKIMPILTAGGMAFEDTMDNLFDSYPEWKEAGQKDNYEQLAQKINAYLNDMLNPILDDVDESVNQKRRERSEAIAAVLKLLPDISNNGDGTMFGANRNIGKGPLMLIVYGAGIRSILKQQAKEVLDDTYTNLMDAVKDDAGDANKPNQVAWARKLIDVIPGRRLEFQDGGSKSFEGSTNADILAYLEERPLREWWLGRKTEKAFLTRIITTLGAATEEAVEDFFGEDFIDRRDALNTMTTVMATVHEVMWKQGYADKLIDTKQESLTPAQEDELYLELTGKGLTAGLRHATSKSNEQQLQVLKMDKTRLEGPTGRVVSETKEKVNYIEKKANPNFDPNDKRSKRYHEVIAAKASTEQRIKRRTPKGNVGAAGGAAYFQSGDGNHMGYMMKKFKMLNIFDAGIVKASEAQEFAKYANEIFGKIIKEWNVFQEALDSMTSSLDQLPKEELRHTENKLIALKLISRSGYQGRPKSIQELVDNMTTLAAEVALEREKLHSMIVAINQFSETGGAWIDLKKIMEMGLNTPISELQNTEVIEKTEPFDTDGVDLSEQASGVITDPSSLSMQEQSRRKKLKAASDAVVEEALNETVTVELAQAADAPEQIRLGDGSSVTGYDVVYPGLNPIVLSNDVGTDPSKFYLFHKESGTNMGTQGTLAETSAYLADMIKKHPDGVNGINTELNNMVAATSALNQPNKSKGSEGNTGFFDTFVPDTTTNLNGANVDTLFDSLESAGNVKDSPRHKRLLTGLISKLIKPTLLHLDKEVTLELNENQTDRTKGVYEETDDGGNVIKIAIAANTSSSNSGIELSAQEVFAHENVHSIWSYGIDTDPKLRAQLKRLFRIAEQNISKEDFIKTMVDKHGLTDTAANKFYDHIFSGKEGYLHEFGSFGLTNEQLMDMLEEVPNVEVIKDFEGNWYNIVDSLRHILTKIVASINNAKYKTTGKTVKSALYELALKSNQTSNSAQSKVDQAWEKAFSANNITMGLLNDILYQPYMNYAAAAVATSKERAKKSRVVGAGIAITTLPYNVLTYEFRKVVNQFVRDAGFTKDNAMFKLLQDIGNTPEMDRKVHRLIMSINRNHDQQKEKLAAVTSEEIARNFHNKIGKKQSRALSAVILKGDMIALIDNGYKPSEIIDLLTDNTAIEAAIDSEIRKLGSFGSNKYYYANQAINLGNMMATGMSGIHDAKLNAYNIAQLLGTDFKQIGELDNAEKIIDNIASLAAMRETSMKQRKITKKVMDSEYRTDPKYNGVQFILGTHGAFKRDSLADNFGGSKISMAKGWTSEKVDEYSEVKVGSLADEEQFKREGYTLQGKVSKDKYSGQTTTMYLYTSRMGNQSRRLSGGVSLKESKASGSSLMDVYVQEGGEANFNGYSVVQKQLRAQENRNYKHVKAQRSKNYKMEPNNNFLVPVFHPTTGEIVNYRYRMSEENKIDLLGKDDRVAETLGRMVSSRMDKVEGTKGNIRVVDALKEDYDENFATNALDYGIIGPDSTDPKLKEIWKLLPYAMKQEVKAKWPDGNMHVRVEIVDMVFGLRKASFTNFLDTQFKKAYEPGLNPNFKKVMIATGRLWAGVVSRAKRNVVLFTPNVLASNVVSNVRLLTVAGVPPDYSARRHLEGVNLINQYTSLEVEHTKLENFNKAYPNDKSVAGNKVRMGRIEKDLETNPLHYIISEGGFQNIIEDVVTESTTLLGTAASIYNAVAPKRVREVTQDLADSAADNGLGSVVKNGYEQITMAPGTQLATSVAYATQISDLVARYALWSYRTEVQGVTESDALNEAMDVFINYDTPQSAQLQWLNDMGIVMYTKFFFRIQKVIYDKLKTQPLRVIADQMMEAGLRDMPDITDSIITHNTFYNKIGNPFGHANEAFQFSIFNQLDWFSPASLL